MATKRVACSCALVLATAAGCAGDPKATTPPRPSARPTASPGAVASAVPGDPASAGRPPMGGAGIVSNNGGAVVSNNAASLAGTVRVIPGLIGNNGGGIIGDGGAGIIGDGGAGVVSNNGGGLTMKTKLRLLALAQAPLPNARVFLTDAAGAPVLGADGKPLSAVTDAAGAYRFLGLRPARNLVLAVYLPDGKGQIRAIAPKDGPDQRTADLDVASSLTTTYILDQYVKGQADPQTVLDKLPPAVDAETRALASKVLDGGVGAPATFDARELVQRVGEMRKADPAFDAQLEAVRKLLVVAGQADLGDGRPGTQVALGAIRHMVAAPGGDLYFSCPEVHRIWRLRPDGILETAVGRGTPDAGSLDGKPGREAGLNAPLGLALDDAGRLVVLDRDGLGAGRVSRLGPDGRLVQLAAGLADPLAVWAGAGDGVHVMTEAGILAVEAGAAPKAVHPLAAGEALPKAATRTVQSGRDAQGRLYLALADDFLFPAWQPRVYRFDPADASFKTIFENAPDQRLLALDAAGSLLTYEPATDRQAWRRPDGSTTSVPAGAPKSAFWRPSAAAEGPGGRVWLTLGDPRVTLVVGTEVAVVAGSGQAPSAAAGDLALTNPAAVLPDGRGGCWIADEGAHVVLRVGADRRVEPVAGTGTDGAGGDGGPATKAQVGKPVGLRRDGAGNLYVLHRATDGHAIRRIDAAGVITTAATAGGNPMDFVVAADGTLTYSEWLMPGLGQSTIKVWRKPPGQDAALLTTFAAANGFSAPTALALDAAGVLHLAEFGGGEIFRLDAAGARTSVLKDPTLEGPTTTTGGAFGTKVTAYSSLAIDAKGRFVFARGDALLRGDPATGTVEAIAGAGTPRFGGASADDSLRAPRCPAFDAGGDLYVADAGHKQIKRIPASELP